MKVHGFAHKLLNEGYTLTPEQQEEFCDFLWEIRSQIFSVQEKLEKIGNAVAPLEKLFFYDEDE